MGWHDPLLWVALQESGRRAHRQFEPAGVQKFGAAGHRDNEPDLSGAPVRAISREVDRGPVLVSLKAVFQTLFGFIGDRRRAGSRRNRRNGSS